MAAWSPAPRFAGLPSSDELNDLTHISAATHPPASHRAAPVLQPLACSQPSSCFWLCSHLFLPLSPGCLLNSPALPPCQPHTQLATEGIRESSWLGPVAPRVWFYL